MSEFELKEAIKETLESGGIYQKLKAEIRAHVLHTLEKPTLEVTSKPQTKEICIINGIVREYLEWCGYNYTTTVFDEECGMKKEKPTRSQILERLGVSDTEESSKLPVLLGIIESFNIEIPK